MTRSWKTALAGILGGILFIAPQVQACLKGTPCDWKQVGAGIAVAALGAGAKDDSVTGPPK